MRMGLKTKLLASYLLLISLPLSILGYLSYSMASNALQKTIEQQLRDTTQQSAEAIDRTLESTKSFLKVASKESSLADATRGNLAEKSNAFNYLAALKKDNDQLLEMLILTDVFGKTLMTNETIDANVDLSDRDYLKKALQGQEAVSDVIFSKLTNRAIVAIAQPIQSGGATIGALIATIPFENISEHAAELKIGQNGYGYMIDRTGLLVHHPVNEKILKENLGDTSNAELKALVNKMKAGETSEGFYTYEGVYKFSRFQPTGNWVIAVTANYDEYMEAANTIKVRTIIIVSLAILIAAIAAFYIAMSIIRPVQTMQGLMVRAGEGDLTGRANISTGDEIQSLGESFNQMISNQAEIVRQVRSGSQELAGASHDLAASSQEINAATEEISASIQQVAHDSQRQNDSFTEVSKALLQLSSLVQIAKTKATEATEQSTTTMESAQQGRCSVSETVQTMGIINQKTQDTALVVQELNNLSTKVGEIINTINAIAAQTDLLALNAAIEAARAGEHGRGFAVVAEEVRKLSEQSHKGATEIAAMVNEMINQSNKAVLAMSDGKQAVEAGVKVVNTTDQIFSQIIDGVTLILNNIKDIYKVTNDEVATSDQILTLIDGVATISENNASNSQQVAAAAEEQSAAVENLTATAEETSAMAETLENLVRSFKV